MILKETISCVLTRESLARSQKNLRIGIFQLQRDILFKIVRVYSFVDEI